MKTPLPLLFTIGEAAKYAGVGWDAAKAMIENGVWPSVIVGRRLMVPRLALEALYSPATPVADTCPAES